VSEGYDVAEEAGRVARAAGKQPQYSRQGEQGDSKHSKQGRAGGQRRPQYQTRGQYPSYSRARYQQAQGPGPAVWAGIAAFAVMALVVAWTLGSNSGASTGVASGNSSGRSTTGGEGQSDLADQLD